MTDSSDSTYGTAATNYSYNSGYGTLRGYDCSTAGGTYGTTAYDPATEAAYDQHMDYGTNDSQRHHRDSVNSSGTYQHRDNDRRDDGTTRMHREYDNPNMGTTN